MKPIEQQDKNRATRKTTHLRSLLIPLVLGGLCVVSTAACAAPDFGNCQVTGTRGSVKLETVTPGALSVRPVLPAPGWWNGDSPDTIKDGFEYCMAANMAHRAGLDRVIVVNRSFAQVVTGQAKGFDIALSEITITDERKKVVNFTDPYFSSDQGVLVKTGTKVDKDSIKKMRLGVKQGTTILPYLTDKVKVAEHPKVYTDAAAMYAALAAGQVDAVLYDTPNVLSIAKKSEGRFEVVGRYDTSEQWGGLVNKDSPNLAAFNKLIAEMKKDGTFDRLATQYLVPSLGADPAKLPILTP
ncbi:ABC transporter substrate-binding protein [Pandoraea oxalativorans]|uniref:ABC transporter substrate-binding protein n=1 Tax=Pandoraea oxalativorans TaxID=573737 RepID=UPI000695D77D|nr:ABC transporter substrate-binding protein [Pandoraea oxalativorans]